MTLGKGIKISYQTPNQNFRKPTSRSEGKQMKCVIIFSLRNEPILIIKLLFFLIKLIRKRTFY